MLINERIQVLIEKKSKNPRTFALEANILPQTLHYIIGERKTQPSIEIINKILNKYPDVNPAWLVTGRGEAFLSSNHLQKNSSLNYKEGTGSVLSLTRAKEGTLLKAHIDKNGIPPNEVADKLGLSRRELFKLFNKDQIPDHYKELLRKADIIIDGYENSMGIQLLKAENKALKTENELLKKNLFDKEEIIVLLKRRK